MTEYLARDTYSPFEWILFWKVLFRDKLSSIRIFNTFDRSMCCKFSAYFDAIRFTDG